MFDAWELRVSNTQNRQNTLSISILLPMKKLLFLEENAV